MPNWCNNFLIVSGDAKELEQFKDKVIEKDNERDMVLKLSNLVPMPDGAEYSRDWCIQNWGTKWEPECYDVRIEGNKLLIGFNSAWSPPSHWLYRIAPMFDTLKFTMYYEEWGAFFGGKVDAQGDEFHEQTAELRYEDDEGNEMEYDDDTGMYKYKDSGTIVDDEDFHPNYVNPFE